MDDIEKSPSGTAIYSRAIARGLSDNFDIDVGQAAALTNSYLKRLTERRVIERVAKGLYGKTVSSKFGTMLVGRENIIADSLIRKDGRRVGYVTGASLFNSLGLCTQVPRRLQIATNRWRARLPEQSLVEMVAPVTKVTDQNVDYLQLVDVLRSFDKYPVDAENPAGIIQERIAERQLDTVVLVRYINEYVPNSKLSQSLELAFGKLEAA
ncbi:MAG: DUF6088 family protein [Coriobacteriia bacterium]|nr:DUF6088 family protein [Coriobacteriia bacterium]MCL2537617.1 DUF6088 family protein [Coriobacteriia bacterium]